MNSLETCQNKVSFLVLRINQKSTSSDFPSIYPHSTTPHCVHSKVPYIPHLMEYIYTYLKIDVVIKPPFNILVNYF